MVSTELLRRYPFFANLSDDQLRKIAMITEDRAIKDGETLFEGETGADLLYLLRTGGVELHYRVVDERGMETPQDLLVGVINPGEVFGISSLINPYRYTASGVVSESGAVLELDSAALRDLCQADVTMYALFLERVASTAVKRLHDTRVLLVAL
jgi:CRP/FNR family cyclic AMP-dependent transcriptional regulator